MSSPTDWSHFYYQNLSNQEQVSFDEQGHDATVVATVTATSSGGHLSPEGRVGKPARKRSRASRRTPTTLLNTDPTNFRAMVQQFTGGPSAVRFASDSVHLGGPDFGFGLRQPNAINPGSLTVPPAGFQLQYQQQQQQQQLQLMQHQNQAYMFSRLGGNNPRLDMEHGSEPFVAEGGSSQVPPSRTGSSNENTSGYASSMVHFDKALRLCLKPSLQALEFFTELGDKILAQLKDNTDSLRGLSALDR
ncbi:hypothetical protein Godav_017295 [Gossypium davidsonii]|uniref:VQ domain-containing protein n=1 Tax=Gossypium davidsonii TaxID=34287 RepID=A0A7J8QT19_GOSDV|nr:hypothetical protein [Gossypium davidsonii]